MNKRPDAYDWKTITLISILILIAIGGCQCAFSFTSVSADELPPLYLEYFLPSIQQHEVSVGLPPDPVPTP